MRKTIWLFSLALLPVLNLCAQKKLIDAAACKNWPAIGAFALSSDGKYFYYTVTAGDHDTLFVRGTGTAWHSELPGATTADFAAGNKKLVARMAGGSLVIISLGTAQQDYLRADTYKLSQHQLLICQSKSRLEIRDLSGGLKMAFEGITGFENSDNTLLMHFKISSDTVLKGLARVLLPGGKPDTIFRGAAPVTNVTFGAGGKVAFISAGSLWYAGGGPARLLLKQGPRTDVYGYPRFSQSGKQLIAAFVTPKAAAKPAMQVWSYRDGRLPSEQVVPGLLICAVDTASGKITPLVQPDEQLADWGKIENDSLLLVSDNRGNPNEGYWRKASRKNYFLVSMLTGKRKRILHELLYDPCQPFFSASGNFVVWYDKQKMAYLSYQVSSGSTRDISSAARTPFYHTDDDEPGIPGSYAIAGFTADDAVVVYSPYDIWKLDLSGRKKAADLTCGYGRRHKMVFRYIDPSQSYSGYPLIHIRQPLLLSTFNTVNKYNGLYWLDRPGSGQPHELFAGPYGGVNCIGKVGDQYLVTRTSPADYGNLYLSTDLRHYRKLTFLSPEKSYNWYTTELFRWRLPDGKQGEGILYKPEDFDAHKKYPVIFYYYERDDAQLYNYLAPSLSNGELNIPWFTSRGYIVCDPDIYYRVGHPGESALASVVSAAKALAKYPWIDANHMGLQGHSMGGFETNYIIARTRLFAAAASSAGISDMASLSFNLRDNTGESAEYVSENGQMRMGRTPWRDPAIYTENSPIYFADKVQTPLLIMHNKADGNVPWTQGLEWFLALRRLGKPAWMLQYDGEQHAIYGEENQLDYTTRLTEFFDHHLRGAPAPDWMK